ncbi:hypothetical protein H0H93_013495 [Arthromyces matolae]|nr:hypothetical protein H0H93_013495 [Arthromyces matolae]
MFKEEKDGRYKSVSHRGDMGREQLWVCPESLTRERPSRKKKKTKSQTEKEEELKKNAVLRTSVADLMARILLKYPRETPAMTKARMMGKGLKQAWHNKVPDRLIDVEYVLQFPIDEGSDVFRQMLSPHEPPGINQKSHASPSASHVTPTPQIHVIPPSPIGIDESPLGRSPDPDVISGAVALLGLKRPHDIGPRTMMSNDLDREGEGE